MNYKYNIILKAPFSDRTWYFASKAKVIENGCLKVPGKKFDVSDYMNYYLKEEYEKGFRAGLAENKFLKDKQKGGH